MTVSCFLQIVFDSVLLSAVCVCDSVLFFVQVVCDSVLFYSTFV